MPRDLEVRLESRTFNDGRIHLFRRTDYKRPIWQARVKVPGAKGYAFRSTKTADEHAAYKFADDLYNQLLVKVMSGGSIKEKVFEQLVEDYASELNASPVRKHDEYKINFLRVYGVPYFKGRQVSGLKQKDIHEFLQWRSNNGRKKSSVSTNTFRCELSYLKGLFDWCFDSGNINVPIRIKKPPLTKNRRPHFDKAAWDKLVQHLPVFADHKNPIIRRDRFVLWSYVLILADTGIRVGEARNLRWRDISQIPSNDPIGRPNIVLMVKGKTGPREVVARTPNVRGYFLRILEVRKAELKQSPDSDSHVFCHKDGKPIQSFKRSFHALIEAAGVEKDTHGQRRTLYSLRHTYATYQLQEGVNQFLLARNMGTSVAMLEDFYGHTSNVEAADELTKSKQQLKSVSKNEAEPLDWLAC